ncbi:MAG: DEAD/DEAH box helicase [Hyphomicrobiales bacterium]
MKCAFERTILPASNPPNIPVTRNVSAPSRLASARPFGYAALLISFRTEVFSLTSFSDLGLSAALLKALVQEGYQSPTPIQARAIPELLRGRDLLGIAQTGTGKTAAFALPIIQRFASKAAPAEPRTCRVLILAPTRELAAQIGQSFITYGRFQRLRVSTVFGGVSIGKQIHSLAAGVDVLVATPGRLVDLIERRALTLAKVEILVLDEVDQMLDLGFIHAIRRITSLLPRARQNLFFSATMPKEIAALADGLLRDPVRVEVAPAATTVESVDQHVIHIDKAAKLRLLADLIARGGMGRTLVFTRTKHGADKVVRGLEAAGIRSAAIHGNKSQGQRERALAGFKSGDIVTLVATDIAARGIDVDGITHVVNYDLPNVPESYVHRIGRTARAGAAGTAIAFCDAEERGLLRDIEKTIRRTIPIMQHELAARLPQAVNRVPAKNPRRPSNERQAHANRTAKPSWMSDLNRGKERPRKPGRGQAAVAYGG